MSKPAPSFHTIVPLIVFALVLLGIAYSKLTLTYNLGFFLPSPSTDAQRVLIERLGQGPGTQLIFVVLRNTDEAASQAVAEALRNRSEIARVLPEAIAPGISSLPQAIWNHRLLLGDLPQSVAGWQDVLEERSMDAMVADDELLDLIAADPTLASISALEAATSATSEPVFENQGERYLLIQTASGAFDLDEQQNAVKAVRTILREFDQPDTKLYGSGVYGVDLQAFVQRESIVFSSLASLALAALVLFRFRNTATALAVGTPLLVGGALGLAVLALTFDAVHGITLAFGFTLLGVAIDYPLHLFSHRNGNQQRSIWPTLSLGIASTLIAYLAFIASGTPGMQQLGVFATVGILGAAGSALLLDRAQPISNAQQVVETSTSISTPGSQQSPFIPNQFLWVVCLAICGLALLKAPLFSNNLSDLTPVPKKTLAEDARLRTVMGVADLRYLISVRDPDSNGVLRKLEQVNRTLDEQISTGTLASYQSVSSLLPSAETQKHRQQIARDLIESGNFIRALENSEFDPQAFDAFTQELQRVATAEVSATPQLLKSASPQLAPLVDSLLYQAQETASQGSTYVALVFLRGIGSDTHNEIGKSIEQISGAEFIDLKSASMTLVSDYRTRVFLLLGGALIAIIALLLLRTKSPARVLWLLGTVAGALALSLTAGSVLLGGLSLFDVIALALVAGLGLDYALFFSRPNQSTIDAKTTQRAITLCALSSLLVFGILSFSSVPLLRGLGVTVASGVAGAYLLARFGRRSAKN